MPVEPQDLQRSKAETANEPFEFKHDGETYTLPPAAQMKAGLIRRFRKLDDLDMAFSIIEELADPATLAALDDMPVDEFNETLQDWQQHIGVSPGK